MEDEGRKEKGSQAQEGPSPGVICTLPIPWVQAIGAEQNLRSR